MNWGILSTARIGAALVGGGARQTAAADVVAVASRSEPTAQAFARRRTASRARTAPTRRCSPIPTSTAVYVPLPNGMHVDWTVRALQAGKHVLCEKPMDRRPERVAQAFDVAEDAGLVLSEAFMWRHNPQTARPARAARRGRDRRRAARARVLLVRARRRRRRAPGPGARRRRADGRRLLLRQRRAARRRRRAGQRVGAGRDRADGRRPAPRPRCCASTATCSATIDCGFDIPARDELEIVGSEGRIVLADPWHAAGRGSCSSAAASARSSRSSRSTATALELEDMAAAIRGERAPLLGRDDALGQARTIEALYRSAAEGRAVALGMSALGLACASRSPATASRARSSTRRSSRRPRA